MASLYSVASTGIHSLLQILELVILTGQFYLLILSFRIHRTKKIRIQMGIQFVIGFFVMVILSMRELHFGEVPNALIEAAYSVPWGVYLVYEGWMLLYLTAAFLNSRQYLHTHLTGTAIKETIDLLPAGILVSLPDGTVQMSNMQMNDLCEELTGKPLENTPSFWDAIGQKGKVREDSILIRSEEDDDVMMFTRSRIRIDKAEYDQILATDVTERYRAIEEVREKNEQLREYQNRMKNYQQMSAQFIRSEEILNARRIVHDQVGHALLTARYYLEHPENVDPAALLEMLRQTNAFLLREAQEDDNAVYDPVLEAARMAETIGVSVSVRGAYPPGKRLRALIGYAIRECAANTVKHGKGDRLFVNVEMQTDQRIRIRLENNGNSPDGPVRETGGLLQLRRMAENMSGEMKIETEPTFAVVLAVPRQNVIYTEEGK